MNGRGHTAVHRSTADRRVRRTRTRLRQALFDLITEKGYDHTTVQDIIDRADVGRSTFYHHYPTKDDLLLSGLTEFGNTLARTTKSCDPDDERAVLAPLRPLFDHVQEHSPVFRSALSDHASSHARRTVRHMLAQTLTACLRDRLAVDDVQFDLTMTYLTDSLLGVLIWWRHKQPHLPAAQVHRHFQRLAIQGLEPVLSDGGKRTARGIASQPR